MAVAERDFDAVKDLVAPSEVQGDAGKRGAQFKTPKAGGARGGFAGFEDFGGDAAAGEIGMDEEGTDFGDVGCGIEEFLFAELRVIGAEESFAFAPAATAGEDASAGGTGFGDEVSAVGDELGIEAEDGAQCAFDLFGSVVVALQGAYGSFDESMEGGKIGAGGQAKGEVEVREHDGENRTAKRAENVTQRNRVRRENEEYEKQEKAELRSTSRCIG